MHFSLIKMVPPGVSFSNAFDDVMLPVSFALSRLGYDVEMKVNNINPKSVNILFGTCQPFRLEGFTFPANSIIFNLEQLTTKSPWHTTEYIEHLKAFTVWDYSHRNARYFRKSLGMTNVVEVRLGYVPEMTRLARDFPQDIDVLFYGAINERRQSIIEELCRTKLCVGILRREYGVKRDHAIARSKLVLNIHYYTPATLEVPRLGYLWANHKPVVSERQKETEVDNGLEEACLYRPYDELIAAVREMAASKEAREEQAAKAFSAFSALRQEDFLEAVVGRRIHGGALPKRPAWLHAGSGKDFRPECLNVDINPAMNPDMVLDLSLPLDPTVKYPTIRFGNITLKPGSFLKITAYEILEHVRDLPTLMRNFLDLLRDGGELHVSVPYELSCGAWQDPAHVRTFNENSWLYYTNWAWYPGWKGNRFDLISMWFIKDDKHIPEHEPALHRLLKTPRAIDGMNVILRKRRTTVAEKVEYDLMARNFYDGAVGEWAVH